MLHENNRNTPAERCLSLQQLTILQYIGQGFSPEEIADKMGTPQRSVIRQIQRIGLSPL